MIAQIPFNGFPKKVKGRSPQATFRLLDAIFKDIIRGWLGLPPYYIHTVGTTGELAVMASSQAQQTIDGMQSKYWRNKVALRVLFEMMRYKPSDKAHQLKMPVMVCIVEKDRETPADLALQIVENAPRGECKSYPVSHFDFYYLNMYVGDCRSNYFSKHLMGNVKLII